MKGHCACWYWAFQFSQPTDLTVSHMPRKRICLAKRPGKSGLPNSLSNYARSAQYLVSCSLVWFFLPVFV